MTDQEFLEAMRNLRHRYQHQIMPCLERAHRRTALLQGFGDLLSEEDLRKVEQIVAPYKETPNTEAYWSEARNLFQSFLMSPG